VLAQALSENRNQGTRKPSTGPLRQLGAALAHVATRDADAFRIEIARLNLNLQ
jgi:hypothetical protein